MKTKVNMHNRSIAIMMLIALLFATVSGTGLLSAFQLSGKAASIKSVDVTVKQASDGNWYTYTKKGNKRVNYTGVAQNGLGWWRTENGKVNFKATGVYQNEYGWWRVENGKVNFKAKGVFQNSYGWWYCKDGKVQFGYNGIQNNKNGWWRIANGMVDFYATGVYQNELGWWYCREGKVDFSYNGISMNGHGMWSIKNGKVDFDETQKLGFNKTSPYVVKRIETDWGVQKHVFGYAYDLDKGTLTVTDQVTDFGYDWGDGGHLPSCTQFMDGLLTPEMFKNHPDIAGEFGSGCFSDYYVLAYNPLVKEGKIKKIILVTDFGDRTEPDKAEYTLTTQGGLLKKVDIKWKWGTTEEKGYISYYYDGKGCLANIHTDQYNEKNVWDNRQNEQGLPFRYWPPGYGEDEYFYFWYTGTGRVSHMTMLEEEEPYMTFNYDQNGNLIEVDSNNPYHKCQYTLSYNSENLLTSLTTSRTASDISPTEGNTTFVWTKL